jgi:hypothetical protein
VKYEPLKFNPPAKAEAYKLPPDPFANIPAPVPIYLKKDATGKYITCKAEEADIVAFTGKDLNTITIRITYFKNLMPQLENLVNLHIQRENGLIDLIIDQNILKEFYREMNVEWQNKAHKDKILGDIEKAGLWLVIIGQLGLLLGTL